MIFYYRYAEPFSFKTCILEEIEKSLKTEAFGSYPNLTSDCFSRQKPISQTGLKDIAWQSFGNLSELVKRPPVHSTICLLGRWHFALLPFTGVLHAEGF